MEEEGEDQVQEKQESASTDGYVVHRNDHHFEFLMFYYSLIPTIATE